MVFWNKTRPLLHSSGAAAAVSALPVTWFASGLKIHLQEVELFWIYAWPVVFAAFFPFWRATGLFPCRCLSGLTNWRYIIDMGRAWPDRTCSMNQVPLRGNGLVPVRKDFPLGPREAPDPRESSTHRLALEVGIYSTGTPWPSTRQSSGPRQNSNPRR